MKKKTVLVVTAIVALFMLQSCQKHYTCVCYISPSLTTTYPITADVDASTQNRAKSKCQNICKEHQTEMMALIVK